MQLWLIVLIVLLILFAITLVALVVRRSPPAPPDLSAPGAAADEARRERRRAAEALGGELLDRRVQLEARRGALGGYAQIDAQVYELEQRLRAGDISEEEFEREKGKLLGG